MKFLCIECDRQMRFEDREVPGDGTLAAVFRCPACERRMALLTNPMETQLVSSLGVKVGGRTVPEQPLEGVRSTLRSGRPDAFADVDPEAASEAKPPVRGPIAEVDRDSAMETAPEGSGPTAPGRVRWSVEAVERLDRVPRFVRGMVKRIYTDWAKERGIAEMTPQEMDRAREELGLEGM